MNIICSAFSYFIYAAYLCLAVWLVQRQTAPGRQYGTAGLLALGTLPAWAGRSALAVFAALLVPLGALAGLFLLAVTAGETHG